MSAWRCVRVADIAARGSNALATGPFGSSIGSKYFRSTGVPVIRGGNLSADSSVRLNDRNLVFLHPAKAAEFSRSTVRDGDLIFTSWGTINQVGIIDDSSTYNEYVVSNKQMKLTPDPEVASGEFLYYLFSGPRMQREIIEGSSGSSIPGFNLTRLKSFVIDLPPLPEQRRIAEILNAAEEYEASLQRTISKKIAIRQGLMQELLTGRTRLPGYTQPWAPPTSLSLSTLTTSGYWGSDPGTADHEVKVIRAGDISSEHGLQGFALRSLTASQAARAKCEPGDVILTASGSIGNVALISEPGYYASNFVRTLRARHGLSGAYLYYALQSGAARAAMDANLGISAIPNLGSGFYREPWLVLPSRQEQAAIVEVLSDASLEINALLARHQKIRDVKTGMMQQLLTGRVRLPKEASS